MAEGYRKEMGVLGGGHECVGTCFIGRMTLFFSIERARSYFEAASGAHFENEVN